jgi:hypothetical protein
MPDQREGIQRSGARDATLLARVVQRRRPAGASFRITRIRVAAGEPTCRPTLDVIA